jgi:hypothetical protein
MEPLDVVTISDAASDRYMLVLQGQIVNATGKETARPMLSATLKDAGATLVTKAILFDPSPSYPAAGSMASTPRFIDAIDLSGAVGAQQAVGVGR